MDEFNYLQYDDFRPNCTQLSSITMMNYYVDSLITCDLTLIADIDERSLTRNKAREKGCRNICKTRPGHRAFVNNQFNTLFYLCMITCGTFTS